jgi:hypothetical protein
MLCARGVGMKAIVISLSTIQLRRVCGSERVSSSQIKTEEPEER